MVPQTQVKISPEDISKVTQALENPEYVWRTADGLVKDTNLDINVVSAALRQLPPSQIVTTSGSKGRLYTTRKHYEKTQSPLGKLLSAVSGSLK